MSYLRPEAQLWANDFTPGYLDSPEADTLPLGATPDAKNAFLYAIDVDRRRAVMGKRPGTRLITPTALASETCIDALFEWRRSGAGPSLLAMCGGELFEVDAVAGTSSSIGTGWTAGNPARLTPFKNDAFVYDGDYMRRWDGTTLYEVGGAAPTGVTNMSAGTGSVTGTYEAVYAWYNEDRDRWTSVTDATSTLVLAGQGRTHTKPSGTPPTWATHWAAFVRRTDTYELNYYYVGRATIATATLTETVSDTVRQRNDLAPLPGDNDAPPGAWKVLVEHKGIGIGILPDSDSYYASKLGDLESWHPKNKFPVSRSTGDDLCWARPFGADILIGTQHASWRLVGTQVPFTIEPVHSSYGSVSQDACLEVDGLFFAWDRVHGPYVTDLVSFRRIGANRIDTILATVAPDAVSDIRIVHDERKRLIGWAVPTGTTSTRRRTILWYHYQLDCWLPPQTGMEYGAFATHMDADGTFGVFMGDYWGRVFEMFSGTREGVPVETPTDNVRVAAVVSATASTVVVNVGAASLYTAGSGLAGLPVAVLSPAGVWQWRRIKSNTGDTITLDTTNDAQWTTTPTSEYTVVIAGIEWFWWTPWLDFSVPHLTKQLDHLWLEAKSASSEHTVTVRMRFNNDEGVVDNLELSFTTAVTAGLWGDPNSKWGVALWATTQRQLRKKKLPRSPLTAQVQFSNYLPDQEIKIPLWGLTADTLPGKKAQSA
ncbi:MAG: hypothetical protein AB7O67_23210 [Vicinamibacterales bacterium]